jgi:Mo-dependent nitrogenase C-terminus
MLNLVKLFRQLTDASTNFRIRSFSLYPIRQWLNGLEIHNAALAHLICRIVPVQCPFERDISLLGIISVHIPPLCKLNPLYEEVVGLRFRALCYLADECSKDVRRYC